MSFSSFPDGFITVKVSLLLPCYMTVPVVASTSCCPTSPSSGHKAVFRGSGAAPQGPRLPLGLLFSVSIQSFRDKSAPSLSWNSEGFVSAQESG